jgi:hypothetical protein
MSADNFISINRTNFEVREGCASCPEDNGSLIGTGKNLEDALKIYDEYIKKQEKEYGYYEVEYGIIFVK